MRHRYSYPLPLTISGALPQSVLDQDNDEVMNLSNATYSKDTPSTVYRLEYGQKKLSQGRPTPLVIVSGTSYDAYRLDTPLILLVRSRKGDPFFDMTHHRSDQP